MKWWGKHRQDAIRLALYGTRTNVRMGKFELWGDFLDQCVNVKTPLVEKPDGISGG
jgi:hypothetical protein